MFLSEEVLKKWFNAILVANTTWDNEEIKAFKDTYPCEYRLLNAFYHLRTNLNRDIKVLSYIGDVYWFTLTFDNKRDKSKIISKRKSATRFLNERFLAYEMVEEFGEDKGRYHIHGFGVFRVGKGYEDFREWPCRQRIECLSNEKLRKKVKYLTKYAVKQLPRRRRSKSLVYLSNYYSKNSSFSRSFKKCFMCYFNLRVCLASFSLYNESIKGVPHRNQLET